MNAAVKQGETAHVSPLGRANEIDSLRFVAAISVLLFHYAFRGVAADGLSPMPLPALATGARYGYLGVELFFMISGFVILMTASRDDVRSFVISRITRLYPAFWCCCTVTFVATLLFGGTLYQASLGQYLINMTMLSGFVGVPAIDGSYWSLFVELRFYGFVALILLARQLHRIEPVLVGWLLLSIGLTLLPSWRLREWFITEHAAYFIAGAAFFRIWSRGLSTVRVGLVLGCAVLSVFQALQNLDSFSRHYGTALEPVTVVGIVLLFFIVLFMVATRRTGSFRQRNWMMLGALTYPLYLLHHNLGFMIFTNVYPRYFSGMPYGATLLLAGTIAVMLGLAFAVNRFVERPSAPIVKRFLLSSWRRA